MVVARCPFGPGVGDYTYKLNERCELGRNSAHDVYVVCRDGDLTNEVPEEVFALGWNDRFVIAETHPVTKPAANNPNCLNCEPDEGTTYAWIIDLKSHRTSGALMSHAFDNTRREMNVPPDLRLMSIDEAKAHATSLDPSPPTTCGW